MLAVFIFLIGIIVGSFINVLSVRVPLGLSIITPFSRCNKCEHKIRFYDNIPIFSYLNLRGKCRDCGDKISVLYPITEVATGLVFLLIYIKFGFSYLTLKYIIFSGILLTISFTDIRTSLDVRFKSGVIPDIFLLLLIIYGLVISGLDQKILTTTGELSKPIASGLISFAFGFLVLYIPSSLFHIIRKKDSLGDGDILLFAGISLIMVNMIPMMLIVASLTGIVAWLIIMLVISRRDFLMPFAPFLSLGALVSILFIV